MDSQEKDPAAPRETMKSRAQAGLEDMIKRKAEEDAMRKCFQRLAETEDGLAALRYIHKLSGHNRSPIRLTSASITNVELSFALQGRIEVYLDLRQLLPLKVRTQIENSDLKESEGK